MKIIAALCATALLAGCASMGAGNQPVRAPEPVKAIDAASFYAGRWYEIGRTPMKLTDGCVAGTTDYRTDGGKLIEDDACRVGTPAGKIKRFAGPLTILDPGRNTKTRADYKVFGVFTVSRTYWMLDHGDDWFVVSDPALENAAIFTRDPRPTAAVVERLKARLTALGYDASRLEFPTQFPPGQS